LELLNFQGGQVYRGGATLLIALRTVLPLAELRVQVSSDSGRTWSEVPAERLRPANGGLVWKEIPTVTARTYRIRVLHPSASVESSSDFAIDSTRPRAFAVGPKGAVELKAVRIDYRLEKSIADIVMLGLYVTRDGGQSWLLHQLYRIPETLAFTPSDAGEYGFYLRAFSQVGLASPEPDPGSPPQFTFRAGAPSVLEGDVRIEASVPSVVKGGTGIRLAWRAESSDPRAKVGLYMVVDGVRTEIERGLPLAGEVSWTTPRVDTLRAKVVAALEAGAQVKWGLPIHEFAIDSTPPRITDVDVDR